MGLRTAEITMSDQQSSPLSRRRVFAAGGTVGALAAAAAVLPLTKAPLPTEAAAAKPAPEKGGGYQLTAHVQQYYDTTRI
jgi:hypothetical protein